MAISATAGWPHLSVVLQVCRGKGSTPGSWSLMWRILARAVLERGVRGASMNRWKCWEKNNTVLLNKNALRTVEEPQGCFLQACKPSVPQCWAKAGEEGYVMGLGGEPKCIGSLWNFSLRSNARLSSLEAAEIEETAMKAQKLWEWIISIGICTQVCLMSPRESVSVLVDTYLF